MTQITECGPLLSVRQKIDMNVYSPKTPYPGAVRRPAYLSKKAYDLTVLEAASMKKDKEEYDAAVAAVAELRKAYQNEVRACEDQFKIDLEVEYGLVGHPKADLLFSKAWEMGHSSGFGEVLNYYDELSELVK